MIWIIWLVILGLNIAMYMFEDIMISKLLMSVMSISFILLASVVILMGRSQRKRIDDALAAIIVMGEHITGIDHWIDAIINRDQK